MNTKEMQQIVAASGKEYMRNEQYAGMDRNGHLIGRWRWVVYAFDGTRTCEGMNPRQCFSNWKKIQNQKGAKS